jgi:hypothetical protein
MEFLDSAALSLPLETPFFAEPKAPQACPYRSYRKLQATLGALMLLSRSWAYAAMPALYRHPLLTTGLSLEQFAATLAKLPVRGNYVRSVICLPFRTLYKQPARGALPRVTNRGALRAKTGSYGHLAIVLKACTKLDSLGLRYCEIPAILPLFQTLSPPEAKSSIHLRSLNLSGACSDSKRRRRIELGRLISSELILPQLEKLHLSDFTITSQYPVEWPPLPALVNYSLLRTWVLCPTALVVPPDAPRLSAAAIGCEPLPGAHMFAYGLDKYRLQLKRLTVIGSISWHNVVLKLSVFPALEELALVALPCGYEPPGIQELPRGLRVLHVDFGLRCPACAAQIQSPTWALESVHAALAQHTEFPLSRIELIGARASADQKWLELDAFARAECLKRGVTYVAKDSSTFRLCLLLGSHAKYYHTEHAAKGLLLRRGCAYI